jgi:hypothetical protein
MPMYAPALLDPAPVEEDQTVSSPQPRRQWRFKRAFDPVVWFQERFP